MSTTDFQKENYDGVLTHNGEIRVAKGGIEQKILHISKDNETCLVKGQNPRKSSYTVIVHKNLKNSMIFAEPGDRAIVKFRRGNAYLIGFIKERKEDERPSKVISEN